MREEIGGRPSGQTSRASGRNEGSAGRKRIAFVGASYKFVHRVVRDMLIVGGFDDCELVLHDIAERPLKIVGDLLEKMIRQANSRMTVVRTLISGNAIRLSTKKTAQIITAIVKRSATAPGIVNQLIPHLSLRMILWAFSKIGVMIRPI